MNDSSTPTLVDIAYPIPSITVSKFGKPFETGAFISTPALWDWQSNCQFFFEASSCSDGWLIHVPLNEQDAIVGLGQHVGPVNCRGRIFRLFSTDTFLHIPSASSLYGAYPFFMILGEHPCAIFVDAPSEILIDAGSSNRNEILITTKTSNFYLCKITGSSVSSLYESYIQLIGQPFIPPKWAFGYHQSRWSYSSESEVLDIANKFKEFDIPCDSIHLDIHYMKDYKVFTVDNQKFPDLKNLTKRLAAQGISAISIIDPGVKIEPNYPVFEEGIKHGYFCKKVNSEENFVGAVWPGPSVFPDFFQKNVRDWWGKKYQLLTDLGILGFWNDMNEPSIFYTPDAFVKYTDTLQDFKSRGIFDENLANALFDKGVCLKESYYDEFTHSIDGEKIVHRNLHNLYGTMMTKAAAEYLQTNQPDRKYFLLSRSSYPGMHRYAAIWTGDNHSWWEHLSLNIQMLISLNLSGMLFTGADIGGFSGNCTGELLVRWTQLGAFVPFFRNHAAMWACHQEPWSFDSETLEICRKTIKLRYAILPYLYSEFIQAVYYNRPFIKGMFYDYPEALTRLNNDQFFAGSSLLIAPVIEAGMSTTIVWLPPGDWLKLEHSELGFYGEKIFIGACEVLIHSNLSQIPVFLKLNEMVTMSEPKTSTKEPLASHYKIIAFVEEQANCTILLDDGDTNYLSWKDYPKAICSLSKVNCQWQFNVSFESTSQQPLTFDIEIWDKQGNTRTLSSSSNSIYN